MLKSIEFSASSQKDFTVTNFVYFSVLKSIEFSASSPTDEVDGEASKTKSLEMLLLEKNKALQTENTTLKVTASDLSGTPHHMTVT